MITILIVDDDAARCERLRALAAAAGPEYEVLDGGRPIASEAEALDKIRASKPQRIMLTERYISIVWQLPEDERLRVIVTSKQARDSMEYLQTRGVVHFGDPLGFSNCLRWECECLERSEAEEGLQGNVY